MLLGTGSGPAGIAGLVPAPIMAFPTLQGLCGSVEEISCIRGRGNTKSCPAADETNLP